jgi:hypothetical protein
MSDLRQMMLNLGVPGKTMSNGNEVFRAWDFIVHACGTSFAYAQQKWTNLIADVSPHKDAIKPYLTIIKDKAHGGNKTFDTPYLTLSGLYVLLLKIGGKQSNDFTRAAMRIFLRVMAGDQTLHALIDANAASDEHKAHRQALALENAAEGQAQAPVAVPNIEPAAPAEQEDQAQAPVAVPNIEPTAPVEQQDQVQEPVVEPVAPSGDEVIGEPLVGQRRRREDNDAEFNSEREYRKLDLREKNVALAQKELEIQEKKILLDEIVRKNKLLDEQQYKISFLEANARAPVPKPNNTRPTQHKQPNAYAPPPKQPNARAPPPKQPNVRAPPPKQPNTRPRQPQQTFPRPKQCGTRLQICEMCNNLFEENKIDNKMYRCDWMKIGVDLQALYYQTYNVYPKYELDQQYRQHTNVYFETDWQMMERVIIQYDNNLRR